MQFVGIYSLFFTILISGMVLFERALFLKAFNLFPIMAKSVLELIEDNKQSKEIYLDLSNYKLLNKYNLTTLPEEIGELSHLESLDISANSIKSLDPLQNLHKLKTLYLSNNSIKDIKPLQNLPNLQTLLLSNNSVKDIRPLQNLSNLQTLYLSNNSIKDIKPLQNLSNLQTLLLSDNYIKDIRPLQNLSNLQTLLLHNNSIKDIRPLQNLSNLLTVYLSDNSIQNITPLQNLFNLQTIDLSVNLIKDIKPLQNLSNLQVVDLSDNPITDLQPLFLLIKEGLNVYLLYKGKGIIIENTPLLQYPPIEVVRKGRQAILNYFEQLGDQGEDHIYEAKLLIVGKGGAGKTSLATKLMDATAPLPQEEDTTRGIEIQQLTFPCTGKDKTFITNIWDFGGQEIYHATHQFFLTKKSLYVLLDDTREDDKSVNEGTFRYWLDTVGLFGAGSPLLIVQNEKGDRSKDIDVQGMQAQFDFIKEKLVTNLKTNRGLEGIHQAIQYQLQRLPHIGDPVPKKWAVIRARLLALQQQQPHIPLKHYYDICAEEGISDEKKALHLSDYLHNLGTILHFRENLILQQLVILQNDWATQAVYTILDNEGIKVKEGYCNLQELTILWASTRYKEHVPVLLELMISFELCYELSTKQHYLIPQLLPESRPNNFTWNYQHNLQLHYQYKFMPKGMLSRLIVRLHRYVKDSKKAWKNGVILTKDKTHAFVEEVYGTNKIKVYVQGEEPRDFLIVVAEEIERLSNSFEGISYEKLVPCICKECVDNPKPYFHNFENIKKAIRKGGGKIQCFNSFTMMNARELIDSVANFEPEQRTYKGIPQLSPVDIIINNNIPAAAPKEVPPSPLPAVPKKWYQEWWFKNILAGLGAGVFVAVCVVCVTWFGWSHPLSVSLAVFGCVAGLLFLKGNPERRFFRMGSLSLGAGLSVFALQLNFSYKTSSNTTAGKEEFLIEWRTEYDWLITIGLILLAGFCFYLDSKKNKK